MQHLVMLEILMILIVHCRFGQVHEHVLFPLVYSQGVKLFHLIRTRHFLNVHYQTNLYLFLTFKVIYRLHKSYVLGFGSRCIQKRNK